jgi:hypothetical protein
MRGLLVFDFLKKNIQPVMGWMFFLSIPSVSVNDHLLFILIFGLYLWVYPFGYLNKR